MNLTCPLHPLAYAPRVVHRQTLPPLPRVHQAAGGDATARPGFKLPVSLINRSSARRRGDRAPTATFAHLAFPSLSGFR
jgi:hypothetical protein